jgi:transcriptional regulator with XRE-family HTH domain
MPPGGHGPNRSARLTRIDIHIGARLRVLRLTRGMGQTEFSKRLGVSVTQVRKYEYGIDRLSASRMFEIARLLDVPVTAFFEGLL